MLNPGAASASRVDVKDTKSDVQAITDLMGTMKLTLSTLGKTFDTLGVQTTKMVELAPAMSAKRQVEAAQKDVDSTFERQNERVKEIKAEIKTEITKQFDTILTQMVNEIIKEIIQTEVESKVRHQLDSKIPKALREEVQDYKRQIAEVKMSLHNSEARRYNALIQTTFESFRDEPLRPLVLPVDSSAPVSPQVASGLVTSVSLSSNPQLSPLTPSPLFPRDLTSLFNLGPEETRLLVQHYGLVNAETRESSTPVPDVAAQTSSQRGAGTASGNANNQRLLRKEQKDSEAATKKDQDKKKKASADAEKAAELEDRRPQSSTEHGEDLNVFMKFIGIGKFELIPTSPSQGASTQTWSPIITRSSFSFED